MPIITACPECNTQFIVTKEQLNAFEGQVRCGSCHHIFNANDHLVKGDNNKDSIETKVESVLSEVSLNEDENDVTEHIEITTNEALENEFHESAVINPTENSIENSVPSIVNDLSIDEKFSNNLVKKPFNWLIYAICLVLLLGLIGQLTYFMRTEISAYYPHTKQWLTLACKPIGCQIDLPKKLDLLTVDDSDMQEHKTFENVLLFSSTLSNHASFAQAYPFLELILTNIDDEPVIRRTYSAKEYLPPDINIDSGINPKEEVRIKLNINTKDTAVSGYRISIHY
ncbi:MAG TPA: hypothetical protein DCO68_13005 [Methylophilaceae bacterium]|nr:hypothetical protein [Methylophilaceae bacterium]HAJ72987.1 hypothetical protein [Methylophilaceae bacterium]